MADSDKVETLRRIRDTLAAITNHAQEPAGENVVNDFHYQLNRLDELGYEVSEWRISPADLFHIVYSRDYDGIITDQSPDRYITRSRLLTKVDPALTCVESVLRQNQTSPRETSPNSRQVWVIFGRDLISRNTIFALLTAVGLSPIEFEQARALTGTASPYVLEILNAAFAQAAAVIALFTGDERVELRTELLAPNKNPSQGLQPRANVIFEAGMAFALHPNRTVIVEMGGIRPFSDIGGIHVIKWTQDTPEVRKTLLDRLRTAGCSIDDSGNYWMTAGRTGST